MREKRPNGEKDFYIQPDGACELKTYIAKGCILSAKLCNFATERLAYCIS